VGGIRPAVENATGKKSCRKVIRERGSQYKFLQGPKDPIQKEGNLKQGGQLQMARHDLEREGRKGVRTLLHGLQDEEREEEVPPLLNLKWGSPVNQGWERQETEGRGGVGIELKGHRPGSQKKSVFQQGGKYNQQSEF